MGCSLLCLVLLSLIFSLCAQYVRAHINVERSAVELYHDNQRRACNPPGANPPAGQCQSYNWGGTSGVHFYTCCAGSGTTYQGGSSTSYCNANGGNTGGGCAMGGPFNCGGAAGQAKCESWCDTNAISFPGMCWNWNDCFRTCCPVAAGGKDPFKAGVPGWIKIKWLTKKCGGSRSVVAQATAAPVTITGSSFAVTSTSGTTYLPATSGSTATTTSSTSGFPTASPTAAPTTPPTTIPTTTIPTTTTSPTVSSSSSGSTTGYCELCASTFTESWVPDSCPRPTGYCGDGVCDSTIGECPSNCDDCAPTSSPTSTPTSPATIPATPLPTTSTSTTTAPATSQPTPTPIQPSTGTSSTTTSTSGSTTYYPTTTGLQSATAIPVTAIPLAQAQ